MNISPSWAKRIALTSCAVTLMSLNPATAQVTNTATHSYAMPLPPAAVDNDFAMRMREHYQGAIDSAKTELAHGQDKQLKKMAEKIIEAQTKEIAILDAWMSRNSEVAKEKQSTVTR